LRSCRHRTATTTMSGVSDGGARTVNGRNEQIQQDSLRIERKSCGTAVRLLARTRLSVTTTKGATPEAPRPVDDKQIEQFIILSPLPAGR
jgi:hypothetical protein